MNTGVFTRDASSDAVQDKRMLECNGTLCNFQGVCQKDSARTDHIEEEEVLP